MRDEDERRRQPRFAAERMPVTITVSMAGAHGTSRGELTNIAETGMCTLTETRHDEGAGLELRVSVGEKDYHVAAIVTSVRETPHDRTRQPLHATIARAMA